jgi:general secretion pathway protein F
MSSSQVFGGALTIATVNVGRKALAVGPDGKARGSMGFSIVALLLASLLFGAFFYVTSAVAYAEGLGIGLIFAVASARFFGYIATPAGKIWKDGAMLKIPIFGQLLRMLAVARFARTLATLLQSGVPLLKAMEIVRNVLGNAKLEQVVEEAASSIREGQSIAEPLKRSGDFPPIVTHMIAVGEKSGQLEAMLENVARAYDAQVETRVQALTSLLEPLMIVIMGGAVGFIAFAILMPLIQMNDFIE